jgi:small neutral amino acid transporter SnatA (MarC family)
MLDFATTAFVSVLFLVDPPGTVPAFIALTSRYSREKRRRTLKLEAQLGTENLEPGTRRALSAMSVR